MRLAGVGTKTVTTAGTPVALGSATTRRVAAVVLTAYSSNTGVIWYGTSSVLASTKTGTPLVAGATNTISLGSGDLDDIYIDSTVNGEGASYTYYLQ